MRSAGHTHGPRIADRVVDRLEMELVVEHLDPRVASIGGMVYVADRGNARIQVLDNELHLKSIYDTVGNPWAVCVSGGAHQYLYASNSWPDAADSRNVSTTGEVYKMELDGRILGRFGKAGKAPKELSTLHEMD